MFVHPDIIEHRLETFFIHLNALAQDKPFESTSYARRLIEASRLTDATKHFKQRLVAPNVGQNDTKFDDEDIGNTLKLLAVATTAQGIAESHNDPVFQRIIDMVSFMSC